MGCLGSPVEKIANLHFSDWKKVLKHGTAKTVKVVRVEELLLIQDDKGKLACSNVKKFAYGLGNWEFARNLMSALVSFGIISQQEASQHLEACTKREISSEAKYDLEELNKLVKKYGTAKWSVEQLTEAITNTKKTGDLSK